MITFVEETGSTNADLLAQLSAGSILCEGDWLVARRQLHGRGRQGRKWFDGLGNFMGSTIVSHGRFDPPLQSIALMAGIAVYEAIKHFLKSDAGLELKWPNDVLFGGAKLSGLLLETSGGMVVVGIGVNLLIKPQIPERKTIALADLADCPSLDTFTTVLTSSFHRELEIWRSHGLDLLIRRWQNKGHPIGTPLTVHDANGELISGVFSGLSEIGSLLLKDQDDKMYVVNSGEVSLG